MRPYYLQESEAVRRHWPGYKLPYNRSGQGDSSYKDIDFSPKKGGGAGRKGGRGKEEEGEEDDEEEEEEDAAAARTQEGNSYEIIILSPFLSPSANEKGNGAFRSLVVARHAAPLGHLKEALKTLLMFAWPESPFFAIPVLSRPGC